MSDAEIIERLRAPFPTNLLCWSIVEMQGGGNSGSRLRARVLPNIRHSAAQRRIEEVFGMSWSSELSFPKEGAACRITVLLPDGRSVSRSDYCPGEREGRAAASVAFLRAAARLGVGAYLYELGDLFAEIGDGDLAGWFDQQFYRFAAPKLPDWAIPEDELRRRKPPAPTNALERTWVFIGKYHESARPALELEFRRFLGQCGLDEAAFASADSAIEADCRKAIMACAKRLSVKQGE